jgi:hypothetical protein
MSELDTTIKEIRLIMMANPNAEEFILSKIALNSLLSNLTRYRSIEKEMTEKYKGKGI